MITCLPPNHPPAPVSAPDVAEERQPRLTSTDGEPGTEGEGAKGGGGGREEREGVGEKGNEVEAEGLACALFMSSLKSLHDSYE